MNYFKEDQIVYHPVCGEGIVIETDYDRDYSVLAEFKDSYIFFTKDGREYINDPITLSYFPFPKITNTLLKEENDDEKYIQEKMYSEEEVKQIIEATLIKYSDYVLADIPEWFEQFKKK
jgi:hypothetical protein